MLEIFGFLFLGLFAGLVFGLVPGLHVNLLTVFVLSYFDFFLKYTNGFGLVAFLLSAGLSAVFLESVVNIFLGVCDDETLNSVLPGHKFVMSGAGYDALRYILVGCFFTMILSLIFVPFLLYFVKFLDKIISGYVGYLLIFVSLLMVIGKKWVWNLVVFCLSGFLGYVTLNGLDLEQPLLPLLTGLFGVSSLISSILNRVKIPRQIIRSNLNVDETSLKFIVLATILGFFASFLPGVGSSQVAILGGYFFRKVRDSDSLILCGGINCANFVLSLITLYVFGKARNGVVVSLSELGEFSFEFFVFGLGVCLIVGSFSLMIALLLGKFFSRYIPTVNYKVICIMVLGFITCLVVYFMGVLGLFVLFVSSWIGILAGCLKIRKSNCMGCLIIPVIFYFMG